MKEVDLEGLVLIICYIRYFKHCQALDLESYLNLITKNFLYFTERKNKHILQLSQF